MSLRFVIALHSPYAADLPSTSHYGAQSKPADVPGLSAPCNGSGTVRLDDCYDVHIQSKSTQMLLSAKWSMSTST